MKIKTTLTYLLILTIFLLLLLPGCTPQRLLSHPKLTGTASHQPEVYGWKPSFKHGKPLYINALGETINRDALIKKVKEYITKHQEISEKVKKCLLKLKICEGYDKEQVRLIWGKPDKIISLQHDSYQEKWIYNISPSQDIFGTVYHNFTLYFKNGTLKRCELVYTLLP